MLEHSNCFQIGNGSSWTSGKSSRKQFSALNKACKLPVRSATHHIPTDKHTRMPYGWIRSPQTIFVESGKRYRLRRARKRWEVLVEIGNTYRKEYYMRDIERQQEMVWKQGRMALNRGKQGQNNAKLWRNNTKLCDLPSYSHYFCI